jgi:predicted RecB family nuclease
VIHAQRSSRRCNTLGERGSIVVYHQHFESQRLSDLFLRLPEFSGRIKNIQQRLWDLLPIIRNHVYHPAFGGSYSLKMVLPALVPEMTYRGMEVADGQAAGLAWEKLLRGELDSDRKDTMRKALLRYCEQDTLGLLEIVDTLRQRG